MDVVWFEKRLLFPSGKAEQLGRGVLFLLPVKGYEKNTVSSIIGHMSWVI
jgi:hypothetical protein